MNKSFLLLVFTFLLFSCQKVKINENERGAHFKKFDGGTDTTKVLQPGNHSIPDWDHVEIYNIDKKVERVELVKMDDSKLLFSVAYRLDENKVSHFHYYVGGDPSARMKKRIKSEFQQLNANLESNKEVLTEKEFKDRLFQNCKEKLKESYIQLLDIRIVKENE